MHLPDPNRISHRRIPPDADDHVHRCGDCGGWVWEDRPCTPCVLLRAAQVARAAA